MIQRVPLYHISTGLPWRERMHELLVRERAKALACRSLLVELWPGYQVFWWRAAQVQEVTGHIVQRAIWRNMRSLF